MVEYPNPSIPSNPHTAQNGHLLTSLSSGGYVAFFQPVHHHYSAQFIMFPLNEKPSSLSSWMTHAINRGA